MRGFFCAEKNILYSNFLKIKYLFKNKSSGLWIGNGYEKYIHEHHTSLSGHSALQLVHF